MMKKKILLSMLLLLAGVSVQAQSVSTEQMDERFNDGTSRYFDLQGRMLSGKPNRGLYINNGKIVFGK